MSRLCSTSCRSAQLASAAIGRLGLIFVPVLVSIGFAVGSEVFGALTPVQKAVSVGVGGVAAVLLLLYIALPRAIWEGSSPRSSMIY